MGNAHENAQGFVEQRREPRQAAHGPVRLVLPGQPVHPPVQGQLIDLSPSGFRAAHGCRALQTGEEVEFAHSGGIGRARVVWLRITPGAVESGFVITARD